MKKIIYTIAFVLSIQIFAQKVLPPIQDTCPTYNIVPLRTFTEIPEDECYYQKDTNNELSAYEGTWKASWNNRTIFITFKKITNKYSEIFKYNKDFLIAKFKTIDNNGNILYDNTNLSDDIPKIKGIFFSKADDRYGFVYIDPDLCRTSGEVRINFTDSTKTQIHWNYFQNKYEIDSDCFFYNYTPDQLPNPLPKEAILVKQ